MRLDDINSIIGFLFALMVLATFGVVLWRLAKDPAILRTLINEPGNDKASLSRFQWLLFTFVVVGLYAILCVDAHNFIEVPNSVLGLLGISTGGALVSKTIPRRDGAAPGPGVIEKPKEGS